MGSRVERDREGPDADSGSIVSESDVLAELAISRGYKVYHDHDKERTYSTFWLASRVSGGE